MRNSATSPGTVRGEWKRYFWGVGVVVILTLLGSLLRRSVDSSTLGMVFLLGVVGISYWWGRGPALVSSLLGVLLLDFFAIPPYYTLAVTNPQSWITLTVMLVVSLVISALATKSRQSEKHRISAENEKNRNALLSEVSHDLKTPLTGILGAASGLLEDRGTLSGEERLQLTRSIYDEADRLRHLVQNLLDMTRLEAGVLEPKKEWQSLEELVGVAVNHLQARLADHPLEVRMKPDLELAFVDGILVEQLLINLLENAVNHTPGGTPIQMAVTEMGGRVVLEVADRGGGLAPGEEKTIFEKFTQGSRGGGKGSGLGLSICRAIALAHGGGIQASNREGGGALFKVWLPTGGRPPSLQEE